MFHDLGDPRSKPSNGPIHNITFIFHYHHHHYYHQHHQHHHQHHQHLQYHHQHFRDLRANSPEGQAFCSSKGICNETTGGCICSPGFYGGDCSQRQCPTGKVIVFSPSITGIIPKIGYQVYCNVFIGIISKFSFRRWGIVCRVLLQ